MQRQELMFLALHQVCKYDQAVKLEELGILQRSTFYWHQDLLRYHEEVNSWSDEETFGEMMDHYGPKKCIEMGIFSAYTVAELGYMLPEYIVSKMNSSRPAKIGQLFVCYMIENHKRYPIPETELKEFRKSTEAEARAAMLIWGIENNLPGFTIKEINNRLQLHPF